MCESGCIFFFPLEVFPFTSFLAFSILVVGHCISKPGFVFQPRTTHQSTNTFENLHLGSEPVLNSGVYRQAILGFYLRLKNWLNKIYKKIFLKPWMKSMSIYSWWYWDFFGTLTTHWNILTFYLRYVSKYVTPIQWIISLTHFPGSVGF